MDNWYDKSGITLTELSDLLKVANTKQFGETENEDLPTFLMCEAFERRFDPDQARAFHLAAMIISRVK